MKRLLKVYLLLFGAAICALWLVQGSVTATTFRCISPLTARRSLEMNGLEANAPSESSSISADGRFVAFDSIATNLVPNDTNFNSDVYVNENMGMPQTTLISVNMFGVAGNGSSRNPSISPDGRYVAFESSSSNLVLNDYNFRTDIFVRDRLTASTSIVSISDLNVQGNGSSYRASISGDGQRVAFISEADNLVPFDTNNRADIFVYDLSTGSIERVSISSGNLQANDDSYSPSISGDGQKVVFHSDATNLVGNDTNSDSDIFLHDLSSGTTIRVSVGVGGAEANEDSYDPEISDNGNFVAFESFASNLVSGDTNFRRDIFVYDLTTGLTRRVSINTNGVQSNGDSEDPAISGDGNMIAYSSTATNLIAVDSNFNEDIFVYDVFAGVTYRVTVNVNSNSYEPSISANGLLVSYTSFATDLIAVDTNNSSDVFVSTTYCDPLPSNVNLQLVEQIKGSNLIPVLLVTLGLLLITVAFGTFKVRKPSD